MNSPPTGDRDQVPPTREAPRPEIELAAAVDDRTDPTTVTLYPKRGADRTTSWLTIGVDWVLTLDEMR